MKKWDMSLKTQGTPSPSQVSFQTSFLHSINLEESTIRIPKFQLFLYAFDVLVGDANCHLVCINNETQDDLHWAYY